MKDKLLTGDVGSSTGRRRSEKEAAAWWLSACGEDNARAGSDAGGQRCEVAPARVDSDGGDVGEVDARVDNVVRWLRHGWTATAATSARRTRGWTTAWGGSGVGGQ